MSKTQIQNVVVYFSLVFLLASVLPRFAMAAAISDASLELSDPRTSETSDYLFTGSSFSTGTTINCIQIEIDTLPDASGSSPTGIDTSSAALGSSTLITPGSWTINNSINGLLEITNGAGETPAGNGNIEFEDIVNGDTEGTYFAVINTYGNVDCSTGGAIDSTSVAFTYNDGELVELQIGLTLTFACTTVAAGQTVNGTTTTHSTTATGVDYDNDVTQSTNGVSAHDLEVTTNAAGGYIIYIRHTGNLAAGAATIDNHTGTNAAPSLFASAGTEAWGYTSEDNNLSGGTADRFTNPGNYWAGFTTNNEPVAFSASAAPTTDTIRVGNQVGISTNTNAGTYQTSIIYTLVATF